MNKDGRISGGTRCACIGHISPEAAVGGPIGLLKDGDIIEIEIPKNDVQLNRMPSISRMATPTGILTKKTPFNQ